MYRFFLIICISFLVTFTAMACQHEYQAGTNFIDGASILPGDTICLLGGNWSGVQFKNIHGTTEAPVVVMNKSGVVLVESDLYYGIKFDRCSHIKISGSGQPQFKYGIRILSVDNPKGTGISIDNKSTDVEVEFIEIANINIGGIYAKTEPDYFGDCSFSAVRDSFTMYNISIHDCYLRNIGNEGLYIGSSKYTGQNIHHCNDTIVLPHVLIGVKIYNNIIENTGWDGIQVSSAISDCEIYSNTIINNSMLEEEFQMSGILIGGGSNCDCYNNKIIGGKGGGIEYLGLGNSKIYNNLIVRSGENFHVGESPLDWQKHGIWVGDVVTENNVQLFIQNNSIISPRSYGIKLTNERIQQYFVENNIIAAPGALDLVGESAYFYSSNTNLLVPNNNLNANAVGLIGFANAEDDNYDLLADSPAVNNGIPLSFSFDIENRTRPFDEEYDIGAYECQDSSLLAVQEISNRFVEHGIKPNPFSGNAAIFFHLNNKEEVNIKLFNMNGYIGHEVSLGLLSAGKHQYNIPTHLIPAGLIFYKINISGKLLIGKAVKF